MNFLRNIGMFFDWAVYGLLQNVFQLIVDLANVEIFTSGTIDRFASRIYIILGLVMLFKIMISFVQILINPDKMNDKEQGMGNILIRVATALALIVFVPSIFDLAREVQNYLLPVIPRVVLGVTIDDVPGDDNANSTEDTSTTTTLENAGQLMGWYSFLAFFNYDNPSCDTGEILGTGNSLGDANNVEIANVGDAWNKVNVKDNCSTDSNGYKYTYRIGLSTVVGVYLLFTLIQVAIKVAIRAIKLGICEFAAPIPIASYIDPKTSKQSFDNWVHTSIKVYFDLFVYLIVVYFVLFVFIEVFKTENLTYIYEKLGGSFGRGTFVTLFIILGLIQFIKQAPKFITDMLGIKGDGGGDIMSIFKGAGSMALASTRGLADIAQSNYTSQKERLQSQGKKGARLRAVASAAAGMGSSFGRSFIATAQGKTGKEMRDATFGAAVKARNNRNYKKDVVYADGSYTRWDYREDKRRQRLAIPATDEFYSARSQAFSDMLGQTNTTVEYGNKKKEEHQDLKGLITNSDLSKSGRTYSGKSDAALGRPGARPNEYDGIDLTTASLGQIRAMATRQVDGVNWTAEQRTKWTDILTDAEKRAKYLETAERIRNNDPEAVRDHQELIRKMQANSNLFNDKIDPSGPTSGQILLDNINRKTGRSYTSIDTLLNDMKDPSKITGDLYSAFKDSFDYLVTSSQEAAKAAQQRQQLFNQAKQNDSK